VEENREGRARRRRPALLIQMQNGFLVLLRQFECLSGIVGQLGGNREDHGGVAVAHG